MSSWLLCLPRQAVWKGKGELPPSRCYLSVIRLFAPLSFPPCVCGHGARRACMLGGVEGQSDPCAGLPMVTLASTAVYADRGSTLNHKISSGQEASQKFIRTRASIKARRGHPRPACSGASRAAWQGQGGRGWHAGRTSWRIWAQRSRF